LSGVLQCQSKEARNAGNGHEELEKPGGFQFYLDIYPFTYKTTIGPHQSTYVDESFGNVIRTVYLGGGFSIAIDSEV
jgi:hypothetical protein